MARELNAERELEDTARNCPFMPRERHCGRRRTQEEKSAKKTSSEISKGSLSHAFNHCSEKLGTPMSYPTD